MTGTNAILALSFFFLFHPLTLAHSVCVCDQHILHVIQKHRETNVEVEVGNIRR